MPYRKVLIAPSHLPEIANVYEPRLRAAGFELVYPKRNAQMTEQELYEQLPGCVASLAGSEPYTARVIAQAAAHGLKLIARAGVGYDGVDVAAATNAGVLVTYAPGTNHDAVGETALMLMLNLVKSFVRQHTEIQSGHWPRRAYLPLRGRTLGIIGLGRTGQAVARRAAAFDLKLISTDPVWPHAFASQLQIERLNLHELLTQADIVTLHVPLTVETKLMMNQERFSLMKPNSYLVNCARGEVVDEDALLEALTHGRLTGAGLDVFQHEPPGDHPLTKLPNVVLTAHTAGVDTRSRDDMARVPAEAIVKLFQGEWPAEWIVNPELQTTWEST